MYGRYSAMLFPLPFHCHQSTEPDSSNSHWYPCDVFGPFSHRSHVHHVQPIRNHVPAAGPLTVYSPSRPGNPPRGSPARLWHTPASSSSARYATATATAAAAATPRSPRKRRPILPTYCGRIIQSRPAAIVYLVSRSRRHHAWWPRRQPLSLVQRCPASPAHTAGREAASDNVGDAGRECQPPPQRGALCLSSPRMWEHLHPPFQPERPSALAHRRTAVYLRVAELQEGFRASARLQATSSASHCEIADEHLRWMQEDFQPPGCAQQTLAFGWRCRLPGTPRPASAHAAGDGWPWSGGEPGRDAGPAHAAAIVPTRTPELYSSLIFLSNRVTHDCTYPAFTVFLNIIFVTLDHHGAPNARQQRRLRPVQRTPGGLQQDYFGVGRAGSSREVFRSQQAAASGAAQDAARFFSPGAAPQLAGSAFDLSALNGSLPLAQIAQPRPVQQHQAPAAWASDFLQHQPVLVQKGSSTMEAQMQHEMNTASAAVAPVQLQGGQQWNSMFSPFAQRPMQNFAPPMMMQSPQPSTQHDQILWDREFSSQEHLVAAAQVQEAPQIHETQQQVAQEADELARTAGLLLETVGDAQNPKFQKSEFMGLMRGLRDREVVVEGNEMVQNTGQAAAAGWASDFQADVKGKGRAVDVPIVGPNDLQTSRVQPLSFASMASAQLAEQQRQRPAEDQVKLEEDPNDAYFRQENAEYQHYWAEANARQASTSQLPNTTEWDHLQADWDNFEATDTGIKLVERYIFQQNNPYVSDTPSFTTRHHLSHHGRQAFLDSVLELEAVVQRNMTDASAWFDLGVKQQANEREKQALQALTRAVELDPKHLPAWLALAISHTNDGNRTATHDAVWHWVDRNERYRDAVAQYRAVHPDSADASITERFGNLIQCLIAMARSDTTGEVDADIQIALAVLLNTNEDYEKAQDCFRTALAVRPDDWLLYNRVGATMANSGRAEEALQYYHRALELNPVYIRARFNLGISCINLRRFEEAAHHILDALGLQESDGVSYGSEAGQSGVTTTALWDSLRTASMHLQRPDLATCCDRQDLEGFRRNFLG